MKLDGVYGLIEKQLLRLSSEEPYEVWSAYAHYNAPVYGNFHLQGEPIQNLSTNARIDVVDELDHCYVVQTEEGFAYVPKDQLSTGYITYGGGGKGGSGGQDGGDISLRYQPLSTFVPQSGDVTGEAEIRADGTPMILGFFDRGETAPVVTEEGFAPAWEGYYTLYLDGIYAYLPMNLAWMEGEEAFQQWEGFSGYSAKLYGNFYLQGEGKILNTNTNLTVLWDGGSFYLVSTADGTVGFMSTGDVGTTRYATGGGGNGGGGQEWSDPVL